MPAWDGSPSHSDPVDYLGRDPDWRDHAACKSHPNPDLFFPEEGQVGKLMAREAKVVCAGCPVKAECLQEAMTTSPEPAGVWGGTTLTDRRNLRKGKQIDFTERNLEIVELLRQGLSKSEVGLRFGLSRDQVRRIERRTA